ncbi:MAG: endonuclease/exonuclease/phosphatase family protein [Phenylobacterium sp.]|uniref:endonuclease/exonuclease/phosphatase family protein n=1 Tax=Phenylobacterium sp. TaxID=1871053 RepID=UPI00391CAF3A
MRVVTLNTWKNEGEYDRRLGLMGQGLAMLSPDVVCLQECFAAEGSDTAEHLGRMTRMQVLARPARAKLRRHGQAEVACTSGLASLTRRPAAAEAACALTSHPADGERIAQRLDVAGEGGALRIVNLHLTHLRGPEAAELRGRQLGEALDWARRDWSGAILAVGDFNAPLEAEELAQALRQCEPPDRPEADHPRRATLLGPSVGQAPAFARTIDHALLFAPKRSWRVRRRFLALDRPDAQGWFPSDHAAVVVDLEPAYG